MTKKSSSKYAGLHSYGSSPNLSRYGGDGKYGVDFTHQLNTDQSENGSVTTRGQDISIEHPFEDVDELWLRRHLTVQFRRANQRSGEIEVPEDESVPQAFDESVIELVEPTFDDEDISTESLPVDGRHVKAILLYDAYDMDSWQSLVDHIDNVDGLLEMLGYDSPPDQSTLWRANESLESEGCRSEITNAAKRAVDVIVCVGLPVPDDVLETHGYDLPPVIDEDQLPSPVHRTAQIDWANLRRN